MRSLPVPALSPPEPQANGALMRNAIRFGRILRRTGWDVGPGRQLDLIEALAAVDISRKDDFYQAAKCVLVSRKDQIPVFDYAFEQFWRQHEPSPLEQIAGEGAPQQPRPGDPGQEEPDGLEAPNAEAAGEGEGEETGDWEMREVEDSEADAAEELQTWIYSANEALRHKDFATFTADEAAEAKRLMAEVQWRLARRPSRRRTPTRRGDILDLRRMMGRNRRYGGELLSLSWKKPRHKPRPLVLICDISGSMDQYSRLLLHFVHTMEHVASAQAEAFVFSTRLTRITRYLKHKDVDAALATVSGAVEDWSGGTRIGECLATFNRRWAGRVLGQGAIVVVISDGWDRGDVTQLEREMAHLQRMSYRLIWLNPLLGSRNYQPLTQGIQAALPYVDDFLTCHSLASLASLGALLERIQARRPMRRQHLAPDEEPLASEEPTEPSHYAQNRQAFKRVMSGKA